MSRQTLAALEHAAQQAGLAVIETTDGRGFGDVPTVRYRVARKENPSRSAVIELSADFDADGEGYESGLAQFLTDTAARLRNPNPAQAVTVSGLPLEFADFAWPFHSSTSGADTFVVHGVVRLADGTGSGLHAKIAAGMTLTFAEIVPAPEQPFAETFVYNAIRKTLDQGQLEMLKSGNRQPAPLTTRYYSRWSKKFNFTDTTAADRIQFLERKLYWLSAANGNGAPVWLADPADAQYLNCSIDELTAAALAVEKNGDARGWDAGLWSATEHLAARREKFERKKDEALFNTKPTFNEEMRAGHTNM